MSICSEIEPFLEFSQEEGRFKPSTFSRVRGIIRAKPEDKKLALVIFSTHDQNGAINYYHGLDQEKCRCPYDFFYRLSKDYELIGALSGRSGHLQTIITIVNSILVRGRVLDALFLMAHARPTRIGFRSDIVRGSFMKGYEFAYHLFSKMTQDGIVVIQGCSAGKDEEDGVAKLLSCATDGRVVIAPQDDNWASIYDKRADIPFSFIVGEDKLPGVACFKDGECITDLRSKL